MSHLHVENVVFVISFCKLMNIVHLGVSGELWSSLAVHNQFFIYSCLPLPLNSNSGLLCGSQDLLCSHLLPPPRLVPQVSGAHCHLLGGAPLLLPGDGEGHPHAAGSGHPGHHGMGDLHNALCAPQHAQRGPGQPAALLRPGALCTAGGAGAPGHLPLPPQPHPVGLLCLPGSRLRAAATESDAEHQGEGEAERLWYRTLNLTS